MNKDNDLKVEPSEEDILIEDFMYLCNCSEADASAMTEAVLEYDELYIY